MLPDGRRARGIKTPIRRGHPRSETVLNKLKAIGEALVGVQFTLKQRHWTLPEEAALIEALLEVDVRLQQLTQYVADSYYVQQTGQMPPKRPPVGPIFPRFED